MASSKLKSILGGSSLIPPDSKPITLDQMVLNNPNLKAFGLYFASHWCGSCRQFTPVLKDFYLDFNKTDKQIEIIYVSSDTDRKMFNSYVSEMPWAALPYEDTKDLRNKLKKDFRVPGLPSLVILNLEGQTITDFGRDCILSDPKGLEFPWRVKSFWEIMQTGELNSHHGAVPCEVLKSKEVVGIYFSGHWSPPCRKFTPLLGEFYRNMKKKGKSFEVVFVSSDHDLESYNANYREMPWLTMPFNDPRITYLKRRYKLRGNPRLVIIDPSTGLAICEDGRERVEKDMEGIDFPWRSKALEDINKVGCNIMNEQTVLIALDPNLTTEQKNMLQNIALEYIEKWKTLEEQPLHFLYGTSGNMMKKIQNFLGLSNNYPTITILNVRSQSKYLQSNTPIIEENIRKLVDDFVEQRIELLPLDQ